jgi:hypothetical protein
MLRKVSKIFFSLSIFLVFFLFSNTQEASANATHNIRGWAYNNTYGHISMNCLDDNFAGRFPFTFTFAFWIAPCSISQHGVNLDANNIFSGQAWNTVLGYIDFEGASTPPDNYAFNVNCTATCNASTNCIACYNENTEKVYGWARVVSTGGWIKLDDNSVPPATKITNYNAANPGIFTGYASSTFGAISFNCTNDGTCGSNPYEVKIGPLQIRQLTAPNWSSDSNEACTPGQAKRAVLRWTRRSGIQSGYEVLVNTVNSTSSPVLDTGYVSSAANQHIFYTASLNYDTPYYWFLKLWDSEGTPTAWRQFNTAGTSTVKDILTDNAVRNSQKNPVDPSKTFTTYRHEFPAPRFTYTPSEVLIGTSTYFTSNSSYYDNLNVNNPCTNMTCSYLWTVIGDNRATKTTPTLDNTEIIFTRATTSIQVNLAVTDSDSLTCSTSTLINANYALPTWKEVKPK